MGTFCFFAYQAKKQNVPIIRPYQAKKQNVPIIRAYPG